MDFYKFSNLLIKHKDNSSLTRARFPSKIILKSRVWADIINLFTFTSKYNYEHSITFYDADSDIVATPPVKGSKTEVRTNHKLSMQYKHKVRDWYDKSVYLNGKEILHLQKKSKDISKNPQITPLFSVHSHPSMNDSGSLRYSFFSDTDVNTLIQGSFNCLGLVTDEFLLLCRYNDSPNELGFEQKRILLSINNSYFSKSEIPLNLLNDLGFILYRSKFKKKLQKLN